MYIHVSVFFFSYLSFITLTIKNGDITKSFGSAIYDIYAIYTTCASIGQWPPLVYVYIYCS